MFAFEELETQGNVMVVFWVSGESLCWDFDGRDWSFEERGQISRFGHLILENDGWFFNLGWQSCCGHWILGWQARGFKFGFLSFFLEPHGLILALDLFKEIQAINRLLSNSKKNKKGFLFVGTTSLLLQNYIWVPIISSNFVIL